MATKTITLELDAYEKLRLSKLPGESFTDVVRRARFENAAPTGADLLEYYLNGGSGVSEEYLDAIEAADKNDKPPDDPWA
jgi:predicted CopG family antitoxin